MDELLTLVNIALGSAPVAVCEAGDGNHDSQITINEILAAVEQRPQWLRWLSRWTTTFASRCTRFPEGGLSDAKADGVHAAGPAGQRAVSPACLNNASAYSMGMA